LVGQFAIMHAASEHVEALLGSTGIKSKDIALAVAKQRHRGGAGKHRLGGSGGSNPALRFLVREIAAVMGDCPAPPTGPDFPSQKSEAVAIVATSGQQRMQQHAVLIALADFPE